MTAELVKVSFHDDTLWAGLVDGKPMVALKPIVEAIGLDWSAQYRRTMRDEILSGGIAIMAIPTPSGTQETVCLPLDLLPGFIFGIDDRRITNPAMREKVLAYKRECYAVLYNHFFQPVEPAADAGGHATATPPEPLSLAEKRLKLEQVHQCRLLFGPARARALWQALGLELPAAAEDKPAGADDGGLKDFIADRMEQVYGMLMPAGVLWRAYLSWCEDKARVPVSNRALSRCLQDMGFVRRKSSGMYYVGLRLKTAEESTTA